MTVKIKKFATKILLSLLLALTVSIAITAVVPNDIVYADHMTCAPGTVHVDGQACAPEAGTQKTTQENQKLVDNANVLLALQGFLNKLIWPVLILIGGLLDNSLLFGNGMEEHLREIWIPIRNLVDILFIIILVGIALYNVLGIGDENSEYSIKSALPKIIIGIIAINFSFLGIKIFLDAINLLTVSVFALPGQVNEGIGTILRNDEVGKNLQDQFCHNLGGFTAATANEVTTDQLAEEEIELSIYRTVASKDDYLGPNGVNSTMSKTDIEGKIQALENGDAKLTQFNKDVTTHKEGKLCEGFKLSETGKAFLARWNSQNAALALALSMGKIVYYEDLHFTSDNIEKLFINTLFSVLLYLVYAASFVALFAVLLARLVVLWLAIVISPILLLIFAAPNLKDKMGGFSKIAEQFVKNAIAPLLIALAMTVGWIMLRAIQSLNVINQGETGGFKLAEGIPVVGLSSLQDLIVAVATIGVVWLGVFGAAEGTLAQFATDAMKGFLQKAGTWLGQMPFKHIPFIPVKLPGGGEEPFSMGEVLTAAQEMVADKPQRRLLKALDITGSSDPSDLEDVKDTNGLYKYLGRSTKANLASEANVEALKKWQKEYPEKFDEADQKYGHLLSDLIKETDQKKRDAIAAQIERHPITQKNAAKPSTPPAAGGKPAASTKPKPVAANTAIDETGSSADKLLPDADQKTAALSRFNRHTQELGANIDTFMNSNDKDIKEGRITTTERDELIGHIRELEISGKKVSKAKLQEFIGKPRYDYLQRALGNDTSGKSVLDSLLASGGSTSGGTAGRTPPTTGGGGAGGPAGGAGGSAGGAPSAPPAGGTP